MRVEHRGDAAVAVDDRCGCRRVSNCALQLGLRAVDDHQVGRSDEDALGVGIEQRADARQRSTSGGKSSKLLTPTTCGPAPMANSISVSAGTSETIRARGSGAEAGARDRQTAHQRTEVRRPGARATTAISRFA